MITFSVSEEEQENSNKTLLANQYLENGKTFLNFHSYYEAIASFDVSLNILESSEAYIGKGNALYSLGRYEEAVKASEAALKIDENNSRALYLKGKALFSQGKYKDALESFDTASKFDPTNGTIYFSKGTAELQLGNQDAALLEFKKASMTENRSDYYVGQGNILFKYLHDPEEAVKAYNKAIQLDPKNIVAYLEKGNVLFNQSKYENALYEYMKGIRSMDNPDKNYTKILETKGTELQTQNLTMSLAYFGQALKLDPKNSNLYIKIGNVLFAQGKYQYALNAYMKGIRSMDNPDKNNLKLLLAKGTQLQMTNLTMSLAYFKSVAELNQSDTDFQYALGYTLFKLGDYKNALVILDKSLQIQPNNANAQFARGHTLFELGRYSDALQAYKQTHYHAISENDDLVSQFIRVTEPSIVNILINHAIDLSNMKNPTMSLAYLSQALTLDPKNSNAYFVKGNVLSTQGKYDDALSSYNTSISLGEDNSTLYLLKGKALLKLGKYNEALESFHESLDKNSLIEEEQTITHLINQTRQLIINKNPLSPIMK
jgi:tetratricopeptide (TPR) repeat protein